MAQVYASDNECSWSGRPPGTKEDRPFNLSLHSPPFDTQNNTFAHLYRTKQLPSLYSKAASADLHTSTIRCGCPVVGLYDDTLS